MQLTNLNSSEKRRNVLFFPLSLLIFWLLFFFLFRLLFFYHYSSSITSLRGLTQGFKLDLSIASYLVVLPFLLAIISSFSYCRLLKKVSFLLNMILVVALTLIELSSIHLYKDWGTTLNKRAIDYLFNAKDGLETTQGYFNFQNIVVILFFFFIGYLYMRWNHKLFFYFTKSIKTSLIGVVILSVLLISLRGGLQKIPLSINSAFYSHHQTDNYLSVNKTFYFISSIENQSSKINIEYQDELATFHKKLYPQLNDTFKILSTDTPNVVLILMEGCPAKAFESLGGEKGLTPNFDSLSKNGLLFTNTYSSGFRTDQGLLSILSGVPAIPYDNLLSNIELSKSFPSLYSSFKKQNYTTAFVYGGDLNFSNIGGYLNYHQVDKIIGESDFKQDERSIVWGVPDNLVFQRFSKELENLSQPFFATTLTQTTHPPFDFSFKPKFKGDSEDEQFRSAVYFMDSCIGGFFQKIKNESWYANTIFIITSDHGSMYLKNTDFNSHERFRIPFLIVGSPLKKEFTNQQINTIGNSHDIPFTILNTLGMNTESFQLSKSSLDTMSNHAYWITEHTMGWIIPDQKIVMNHNKKEVYFLEGKKDTSSIKNGLMYYNLVKQYINK